MAVTEWVKRAKDLMRIKGITQEQLAERLGCSQGALSHWLSGRRSADIQIIESIAQALGVEFIDFFYETTDSNSQKSLDEEADIIKKYRSLTPDQKTVIMASVDALAFSNIKTP